MSQLQKCPQFNRRGGLGQVAFADEIGTDARQLALGLDRETVDELIDRIEVGEKTVIDGKNVRGIKIYYRFVGNI